MRIRALIILAAVFFVFFSPGGWAIDSPVGSGTVPPSSTASGLFRSPNPIDTSGNLVVTGNIGGGRYFRGIVPYRAASDFSAPLGSSSLDSFLRDSAGSEDFGHYTGKARPYYSLSRTAATTIPGTRGVLRQPGADVSGLDASGSHGLAPPSRLVFSSPYKALPTSGIFRPMSMTAQELERIILNETGRYPKSGEKAAEQEKGQIDQFRRDLRDVSDKVAELRQELIPESYPLPLSTDETEPGRQATEPFEMQKPTDRRSVDEQIDIYERMEQQIEQLKKSLEAQRPESPTEAEESAEVEKKADEKSPEKKSFVFDRLAAVDSAARAKAIRGEHKTFASFSKDKFNRHLRAAEEYLKLGKYYRAADAYTLASIYKPRDPLAYAGKGHALFAAGEYMSSSLFLSRAIEIFPEYVWFKVDLDAMIGDRDRIETRIADIRQRLEIADVPELQFLLGYVYYRLGRFEWAKRAIDAAYEKMPQSIAVAVLSKAICASVVSN